MKFIRLRIANYRGVAAAEVIFGPTGITIVQGPNEAGKTSLAEAIGLLFDYPDSSKHRNVDAIKPVHRDEGPEIELQAESGPYLFTYFKRFQKKPETKLTVTKPKPESLTGRDAHEHAEAILRETLDIDLWKALIIEQGDEIQQPDLSKQTSLSAALDKAAGGRSVDPREESLFDKVRDEYNLYYTAHGSERKEMMEARKAQKEAEAGVANIEKAIRDLENDIERAALLQRELGQLKKQEEELTKELAGHTALLEEIAILESALTEAKLKLESAKKSEQAARRDMSDRQGLVESVDKAKKAHSKIVESVEMSLSALTQAESDLKKAQDTFDESDRKRKGAEDTATLRRSDFDYYNNKLYLDQFRERKTRIDEARRNAAQAEELLSRNKVDARALKSIQDAERDLLTASAQLETAAPGVLIRGLSDCRVFVEEAEVNLQEGEVHILSVSDKSRFRVPDVLEMEITAGASTEGLTRKVEEARRALADACHKVSVSTPDEARKAFDARRDAKRHIESKAKVEKENLRDLTYEELDRKLYGLEQSVPAYIAERVTEPGICPDMESAKRERSRAEAHYKETVRGWEADQQRLDAARSVRDGLNTKHLEFRVQLDILAEDFKNLSDNLERARNSTPDSVLEKELKDAFDAAAREGANVRAAEASLKEKNPEKVKVLAETVGGSLRTAENRRTTAQTELTEVQTRLKIHGEEGLYEQLHMAQIHLERVAAENLSLQRRASSARCLFETMRDERDKARRAYVKPLKEKIEYLGRLVFDDSFQVDISDDLQIVSRTVDNITVPFNYLSGGTREQLSLIFRSACAMIVAEDGGAPMILDDTLGYTDPERLRMMGAVLARAAKECQIIILTCIPERYGNVGEATISPLN